MALSRSFSLNRLLARISWSEPNIISGCDKEKIDPHQNLLELKEIFKACMAGIVFAKFTKPTKRAETILFR